MIQGNPVRSVAELISAPTKEHQPSSRIRAAREFLAVKPAVEKEPQEAVEPVSMVKPHRGKKRGKLAQVQN